jgi:hypothetical protein
MTPIGEMFGALPDVGLTGLHDTYATSMRSSLFTGFLTLSSFLLATKTLLVIQFRKDVYEYPEYLKAHVRQRAGESVYASLEKLARLLNTNILLALATSAAQFTLGFVESAITTLVCLFMAAGTVGLTWFSVLRIRENLSTLFVWLNMAADDKIKALTPAPTPVTPPSPPLAPPAPPPAEQASPPKPKRPKPK